LRTIEKSFEEKEKEEELKPKANKIIGKIGRER
jgi:hypothetical protein